MNSKIIGTGRCIPKQKVTNDDLSKVLDTSDEWISSRTGIRTRYIADKETSATMAGEAAKAAIVDAAKYMSDYMKADAAKYESAHMRADVDYRNRSTRSADSQFTAEDIDAIIVATSSPDYAFPSTAAIVQRMTGAVNAACFDISVACTGFIYAMSIADAYIRSGIFKNILVIGAEVMSRQVDWSDRSVCVLFGDGAAAAVVTADSDGYFEAVLHSDGSGGDVLTSGRTVNSRNMSSRNMTSGNMIVGNKADENRADEKKFIYMDGQEVFRFAVKKVPESINELLERTETSIDDVKYFILHQANVRIIESVAKRLNQNMEKFPVNLQNYGNTSAASIPILLDEMNREHKLQRGDQILLSGFGAGLSWGSALIRW